MHFVNGLFVERNKIPIVIIFIGKYKTHTVKIPKKSIITKIK